MNHDRHFVLGAHLPERIDARVVGLDVRAVRVPCALPEAFRDLDADCAGLEAALRERRIAFGPAGLVDPVRAEGEERRDATLVRETRLEYRLELIA
jgi:hypothetical protein